MEEVEGRDGPGCCSTRPSSDELTSKEVSSAPPLLSGSGEVEEEWEVVEEVEEDEDRGEVSEQEAGGRKDMGCSDSGSEDSSPPADVEAPDADVGAEAAPPACAAPLLYS